MNAFYPDYIRTFHPQFLSDFRFASYQMEQGKANAAKMRHTRESVKSLKDMKSFPDTRRRA
jgi:hypothetical protein